MANEVVEVCYDDRFGKWKVDLYERDRSAGAEVHKHEEGEYHLKTDAEEAADDLARLRSALVRVETREGRVQKERRPS